MSRFSDTIWPKLLWVSVGFNLATLLLAVLIISAPGPFANLLVEYLMTRADDCEYLSDGVFLSDIECLKEDLDLTEDQCDQLAVLARQAMLDEPAVMQQIDKEMRDLLLHVISNPEDEAGVQQRWEHLVDVQETFPMKYMTAFRQGVLLLTSEQRGKLERQVRSSYAPFWFDLLLPTTFDVYGMDGFFPGSPAAPNMPDGD